MFNPVLNPVLNSVVDSVFNSVRGHVVNLGLNQVKQGASNLFLQQRETTVRTAATGACSVECHGCAEQVDGLEPGRPVKRHPVQKGQHLWAVG